MKPIFWGILHGNVILLSPFFFIFLVISDAACALQVTKKKEFVGNIEGQIQRERTFITIATAEVTYLAKDTPLLLLPFS